MKCFHRSRFYGKAETFESPQKNQKLPYNTNMFFQPMIDFYTLIMKLLAHDLKLRNLVSF